MIEVAKPHPLKKDPGHSLKGAPKAASSTHGGRHAKLSVPKSKAPKATKKKAGTSTRKHKSASKTARHKTKVAGPTAAQSLLGQEYEGEALAAQAEGYTSPYASEYGLIPETTPWNMAGSTGAPAQAGPPNPNAARLAKHRGKKNPAGASPRRATANHHGHKAKGTPKAHKTAVPKTLDPASLMGHASTPSANHMAWPQLSVPAPHRSFQS